MFGDNRYVGKDLKKIREEIIEFIKQNNENWTDFNMSSIQLQYTEILAGVADMLCYYLDNQALETFLSTARQAKNIKGIFSTMNYKIEPIGTAKGEVVFSRKLHEEGMRGGDGTYEEGRFLIPKYTRIGSDSEETPRYLTIEERLMDNSVNELTIPVVQGILEEVDIPINTVRENFKLYLTERPVPLEYVEIVDDTWEKVDDAFIETSGGKKYSVHTDSKDMVYILFTYDWTHYLSNEEGQTMKIRYIESEGSSGRVDAYELNKLLSKVKNVDTGEETNTVLSVINKDKTYGAFDSVNLNKQKANARNYLKTYDTIVLLSDLETMVRKETWVKDCVVYDWRKNDNIVRYPHQMKAWVITVDGVDVSGKQLATLTDKLQKMTVSMTQIEVLSAEYSDINFKVGLEISGTNESVKENLRASVENILNQRYSLEKYLEDDENSKLCFGFELDRYRLELEIRMISSSIQNVVIDLPDMTKLTEIQFPNIGNIEVYLI